jgi:hypothetical protein
MPRFALGFLGSNLERLVGIDAFEEVESGDVKFGC